MPESFDLIVIGAGPGGHALAEHAARHGARTAIIEKDLWGGTCTHRGCIPTKALLACSRHYADLKKTKRLGIFTGQPSFDFAAMKRHQQQMVRISAMGVEKSLRQAGVSMKAGEGSILSPCEVQWTDPEGKVRTLRSGHIALAWGSEPALPPGVVLSEHILTSDGFLRKEELPDSVIIVGGSVIGVEFATLLAELGVKVILIEWFEQILPYEDEDVSNLLKREMTRLGVVIHASTELKSIRETAAGVEAAVVCQGRGSVLTAAEAIVCTGRKPLMDRRQLETLGIRYDLNGIRVDAQNRTNIPGICAIGDVTGGAMLAHRAIQQGKALASRLFGDGSFICDEASVPVVVYSHPQVARVGLTERQAGRQGLSIEVMKSDYAANMIARTELMGQGFVKMLFGEGRLIGATIVGDTAADLIASMSMMVACGLGRMEMRRWIIPHPTLSEVLIHP